MTPELTVGPDDLPLSAIRRIDDGTSRFEAAWTAGQNPRIEDYLGDTVDPERAALFGELLLSELELRAEGDTLVDEGVYRQRFPEYASLIRKAHAGLANRNDAQTLAPPLGPPEPGPDLRIPGYDIVRELGRGGMGIVYLARDQKLGRQVALKCILAGAHADPGQVARFRTEARAIARLSHPNIVQVFEVGEHDGRPYLALEYVEGGSLAEHLGRTPQPARDAAQMIETVARAVHHAHQQGIVHRDLKPANILLQRAAAGAHPTTPKITDFGLAKQLDADGGRPDLQTMSGAVLGTPRYMAPEQARGTVRAIGPATDVYALGVILYEMLTGRVPFQGAGMMETLSLILDEEPVPPARLNVAVPADLNTICLKCLHKEPSKRYAGALDLAEDVRRFSAGEPIVARPTGSAERMVKWGRRHPAVCSLLGLLAVVIVASLGVLGWRLVVEQGLRHQADRDKEAAQAATKAEIAQRLKTDEAWAEEKNQRGLAEENLALADVLLGFSEHARDPSGSPREVLQVLDECPSRFRHFEWHLLHRRLDPSVQTLNGDAAGDRTGDLTRAVEGLAFSPDDKLLAAAGPAVHLWDWLRGERRHTFPTGDASRPTATHSVAFSPKGQYLAAAGRNGAVWLWDSRKHQEVWSANPPAGLKLQGFPRNLAPPFGKGLSFSPDGKTLAAAVSIYAVAAWDVPTKQLKFVLDGDADHALNAVAFDPTGKWLACGTHLGRVTLYDATDGRKLDTLSADFSGSGKTLAHLAFSPDGELLAAVNDVGAVQLWNTATRQTRTRLDSPRPEAVRWRNGGAVAFSPDSKRLAVAGGQDRPVRLLDLKTFDTRRFPGHWQDVRCLAFDSGGRFLASSGTDGTIKVWDTLTPNDEYTLPLRQPVPTCLAFRPGSGLVATGFLDGGEVVFWEVAQQREVRALPTGKVSHLCFSTDGKELATVADTTNVWEAATGKHLLSLKGEASSVAFHPGGQILATHALQQLQGGPLAVTVNIWSRTTGKPLHSLKPADRQFGHTTVVGVAFHPAGKHLAVIQGKHLGIWDWEKGQEMIRLTGNDSVLACVDYSPDGKRVATGEIEGTIQLWGAEDGRLLHTLTGHTGPVTNVRFSADGKRLVSGGPDGVKLWHPRSGKLIHTFSEKGTRGVAMSPGNRFLAAIGEPMGIQIWDAGVDFPRATGPLAAVGAER